MFREFGSGKYQQMQKDSVYLSLQMVEVKVLQH